ncbi:hypothetical protein [Loigolactobacillus rennini]|uniref:Uncharacterized protein n=2 Tax=Loigolactobacillus rennini TaxID=238013 RepID=A0A0R2D8U1_9LACO|nr:hypothetical protein [Loigolactobacillus rennini]KRM97030.1 hypothetical protein FC24_GL001838 [Loigolactobacillus rennini DSM 20253]SFZ87896.1 hypothetical protein LREN565_1009 [Loigolactobacillus rennini]
MDKQEQPLSRAAYRKQKAAASQAPKLKSRRQQTEVPEQPQDNSRLKRRLNWAIGIVVVLIILVYLVLFFV